METFNAFFKLWRGRNSDHITLLEIEAYVRLFSIPNKETFAEFILAADDVVHKVQREVQAEKERVENLNQSKGR